MQLSSIRAATSFGLDMWTAWLAPETSTLWLLVRVAYRAVARRVPLEEILKHLTVMDASQVEMSTSLMLDRLVFREKTSVLKGFRPSLQRESNQPTPEYRRVAQAGRISR
jgi:hypothetical protein